MPETYIRTLEHLFARRKLTIIETTSTSPTVNYTKCYDLTTEMHQRAMELLRNQAVVHYCENAAFEVNPPPVGKEQTIDILAKIMIHWVDVALHADVSSEQIYMTMLRRIDHPVDGNIGIDLTSIEWYFSNVMRWADNRFQAEQNRSILYCPENYRHAVDALIRTIARLDIGAWAQRESHFDWPSFGIASYNITIDSALVAILEHIIAVCLFINIGSDNLMNRITYLMS